MTWNLMINARSCFFNTFAFIFTQISSSASNMPAGTLPIKQLIATDSFDSHFKIFLSSCRLATFKKKEREAACQ